jgi:membrane-associated protease RseP (regulator of RpoE activity)
MLIAIGVILFALGLLLSIAWHELGHLTFAKLFNVRTTQYMVGFGKTIWSRRLGETEYGIKAIPIGGYIRMVGMVPPSHAVRLNRAGRQRLFRAPATTGQGPMTMLRQLVEDTRRNDRANVDPELDDGRQFYQLHPLKRIVIMFAGPFMNLILAVVLFGIVLVGIGVPTPVPTIAGVQSCILTSKEAASRTCTATDQASPASKAGLLPGDTIVNVDGVPISDWSQLKGIIASSAGKTVTAVVSRDGALVTTSLSIIQTERYTYDDAGKVTGTEKVGVIGVLPQTPYVSQSPWKAITTTGAFIGRAATALVGIPARIPALWNSIFSGQPRDVNTPIGIVGAGRISAEIVDSSAAVKDKIVLFLQLLAGFNMSLFLLNMLPLLPLDGGHILGAIIEWVKRGWARLAHRPDPGPFDVAKLMPVAYIVALLFIGLTVLTLVADVVNPVRLFG